MAPKISAVLGLVLAAALVLPAVAATPKSGSWSGSTKQGKSIGFTVTPGGGKVKKLKFGYRGRCDNGVGINGTANFPGPFRVSGGSFTAKGGSTVVRGNFGTSRKATGTIKWRGTYYDPISFRSVPCESPKVGWTARR